MAPENPKHQFLTTQWTRILSTHHTASNTPDDAIVTLCENYRAPVYAFILKRNGNPSEADDLTQSFFASLIEKKTYRQADRQRGRFRTFLLTSVKNFLHQNHRNQQRQKRGGAVKHLSLNTENDPVEIEGDSPTDEFFDKNWAISIFDRVWRLLEEEYQQTNQLSRFETLRNTLTLADDSVPYADLAKQLKLSINGVKSATFRLRSRFRELFRATVAQLIDNPSNVDDEIRYLMEVMIKNKQNLGNLPSKKE